MSQPVLSAVLAALVVLAVVALVVVRRRLRTATAQVAEVRAEAAELRSRLERLEAEREPDRDRTAAAVATSYVITEVGLEQEPVAAPVEARLFADTFLREAMVRGAGLGYGVRRALTPEVRHHIRLEMRREVRRARKQRKSDLRVARRAWEAAGRQAERPA